MKQIYKILSSLVIMTMVISVIVDAKENIPKDINTSIETSSTNSPNLWVQVCCMEDEYWNPTNPDTSGVNLYFQLPVTIEIWNDTIQPIKNAKVTFNIFRQGVNTPIYRKIKYTDSNGKAKFGFSLSYPIWNLYGTEDYYTTIKAESQGKVAYYWKHFKVKWLYVQPI